MDRSFEGSSLGLWQSVGSGRLRLAAGLLEELGRLRCPGDLRGHHTGLADHLGLERERVDLEPVHQGKEHPGGMMVAGSMFVSMVLQNNLGKINEK